MPPEWILGPMPRLSFEIVAVTSRRNGSPFQATEEIDSGTCLSTVTCRPAWRNLSHGLRDRPLFGSFPTIVAAYWRLLHEEGGVEIAPEQGVRVENLTGRTDAHHALTGEYPI